MGGPPLHLGHGSLLLPSAGLCLQFEPELVLVSAGFDSAIGDPEVRAWPGLGNRGSWAQPGPYHT